MVFELEPQVCKNKQSNFNSRKIFNDFSCPKQVLRTRSYKNFLKQQSYSIFYDLPLKTVLKNLLTKRNLMPKMLIMACCILSYIVIF